MQEFYAYHVVSDRPMVLGQQIICDASFHNGVWNRVYEKMNEVEAIYANPNKYADVELEYRTMVALRELALEEVRLRDYPTYPSRMACLYVSEDAESSKQWAEYFIKLGRPTFAVVKLKIKGNCFVGDASNCFDGKSNQADNLAKAEYYWRNLPNVDGQAPVKEMLVNGEIEVVEIIEDYLADNYK